MKVRYSLVDKIVETLASTYPELLKAPIKIEKFVKCMGVDLVEKDFDHEISGAAIISGDKKIISINKRESPRRKRFTIAHELGHILLHYDQELNIDLKPIRLNRDVNSTTGESWREIEANYFAASMLMPSKLVLQQYAKLASRLDDEDLVLKRLSAKFRVSLQAMSIKLSKLGLLGY